MTSGCKLACPSLTLRSAGDQSRLLLREEEREREMEGRAGGLISHYCHASTTEIVRKMEMSCICPSSVPGESLRMHPNCCGLLYPVAAVRSVTELGKTVQRS